jgi:4-hydroxymandelate synthase
VHCEQISLRSTDPGQTARRLVTLLGLEPSTVGLSAVGDTTDFLIGGTRLAIDRARTLAPVRNSEVIVDDIAIATDDFDGCYRRAIRAGAIVLRAPSVSPGTRPHEPDVLSARVHPVGLPPHTLIEHVRSTASRARTRYRPALDTKNVVASIDHLAFCLPPGALDAAVRFAQDVLGFEAVYGDTIETGGFGLVTRAVRSKDASMTYVLNCPLAHCRRSHIDDFIDKHGAGVQHIAFGVSDIFHFAQRLSRTPFRFLKPPEDVYASMASRLSDRSALARASTSSIMLDEDEDGQLAQAFVTPFSDDTASLFLEFIERRGSRGFGAGNIKDLFSAAEKKMRAAGAGTGMPALPEPAVCVAAPRPIAPNRATPPQVQSSMRGR